MATHPPNPPPIDHLVHIYANGIAKRRSIWTHLTNPTCLDMMNIPVSDKEEVMKILRSKQLFFKELCSYHNGTRLCLPHDSGLYWSLKKAVKNSRYYVNNFEEIDEDAEGNDVITVKRLKRTEDYDMGDFNDLSGMKIGNYQSMMYRMEHLEEQRLHIEKQRLELEKVKLKWQRIDKKENMKLKRKRLENERLRLENKYLESELKFRERGC